MLTERGRLALALAGGIYLVAWGFGSRSLYPVAVGLALAALGARIWVSASKQPITLRRSLGRREHLEGDDVTIGLEAQAQRYPGRTRSRSSSTPGVSASDVFGSRGRDEPCSRATFWAAYPAAATASKP